MWDTIKDIATEFVNNTGLSIVRAIAFFVLGLIVVKIVRMILQTVLFKSRLDGAAATFVISIVTIVLYVALVIVLVSTLGFSTASIIAAFSAVALAVILALKDSLSSLANGIIIIFTKPFKKGDYVKIGDKDGLVQDIRLFNTKILTYSNEEIIIPNSDILTTDVVNYSTMPLRRIVFSLPVPYTADISEVKKSSWKASVRINMSYRRLLPPSFLKTSAKAHSSFPCGHGRRTKITGTRFTICGRSYTTRFVSAEWKRRITGWRSALPRLTALTPFRLPYSMPPHTVKIKMRRMQINESAHPL